MEDQTTIPSCHTLESRAVFSIGSSKICTPSNTAESNKFQNMGIRVPQSRQFLAGVDFQRRAKGTS